MKKLLFLFCSIASFFTWGQMSDSFDDGDFTNDPAWTGTTADFIVNSENELQLNAEEAGTSFLATPHNLSALENKEWRFRINYAFSPSNNNYGLTYLAATSADLEANPDGIFVKIGENGNNDPIRLFAREGGVETEILSSTPAVVAQNFNIAVKIIYRDNGDWELYYDTNAGENYLLDALSNYPTNLVGTHLGLWLKYTISNNSKFKYDDFYAGEIIVDLDPPLVDTVYATSATEVSVRFNEAIDLATGTDPQNYTVDNAIGNPINVEQDPNNLGLFHLTLGTSLTVGQIHEITIKNVEDLAENVMETTTKEFIHIEAQTPAWNDIVINEFIPRVAPAVGLPEVQFVEIYNRSDKYFNLNGWKLRDNNSAGTIEEVWLFPGEYLLLVPTAGLADYPNAAKVTSWATLNQTGDEIHLETDDGFVVDELTYTNNWYKDENKKNGGWTIERINPDLTCSSADNWRASNNPSGGTPGAQNSVFDATPDTTAPTVISAIIQGNNQIDIAFSEGMDSLSLVNTEFNSSPSLTIANKSVQGSYPTQMTLTFNEDFEAGIAYNYSLADFADCSGNTGSYQGTFMLPQSPNKGDLIINEVLFNPLTGGSDFVEIYNKSDKYIDLKDWELANYKDDTIANNKAIPTHYILAPDDYVVITKDSSFQLMNYPMAIPGKFIQIPTLPSYNNDSSTVVLIYNDTVMDLVAYQEDWHFSLLSSKKGVSLERFSATEPSNSAANWHSASETVGFATPGRRNSQQQNPNNQGGTLSLSSKTFSPDNDGFEDVLILTYEVTSPDLLGSITIYDDKGRKIKSLMSRELLGGKGSVKWEGTRDDGGKVVVGPYVIVFEMFDVDGGGRSAGRVVKVVTVAGKVGLQ